MTEKKNKHAQAMVALRWAKAGITERFREAARRNGKLGGRPKLRRCPCGKMTVTSAKKLGHKCVRVY